MSAQRTAFRAELTDLTFGPSTFQATITLPNTDWGDFYVAIGRPSEPNDGEPSKVRSVGLLACATPRHPEDDRDALALACARGLVRELEDGEFRLTPAMLLLLGMITGLIGRRGLFNFDRGPRPESGNGL